MNVSNFILTKETKEKMSKKISDRRKGELRMDKLKELAESGKLAMIKNKGDLAEAVGFPHSKRSTSGYQWVKYRVDRGDLNERFLGYKDGIAEYEYSMLEQPPVKIVKKAKKPMAIPQNTVILTDSKTEKDNSITITHKDTTITLNNVSDDVVVKIIEIIAKQ